MKSKGESPSLGATSLRPGDFPLGSVESRATARALVSAGRPVIAAEKLKSLCKELKAGEITPAKFGEALPERLDFGQYEEPDLLRLFLEATLPHRESGEFSLNIEVA